jgi:hypothetical protein
VRCVNPHESFALIAKAGCLQEYWQPFGHELTSLMGLLVAHADQVRKNEHSLVTLQSLGNLRHQRSGRHCSCAPTYRGCSTYRGGRLAGLSSQLVCQPPPRPQRRVRCVPSIPRKYQQVELSARSAVGFWYCTAAYQGNSIALR